MDGAMIDDDAQARWYLMFQRMLGRKEAEMARNNLKCIGCGHKMSAHSEAELISKFRQHAREQHNKEMSERQVKEMIQALSLISY
jgi:predicted small metal-binding protein